MPEIHIHLWRNNAFFGGVHKWIMSLPSRLPYCESNCMNARFHARLTWRDLLAHPITRLTWLGSRDWITVTLNDRTWQSQRTGMFSPSPALLFFLAVLAWITVMELSVLRDPLSHPPLSAFLPPPLYFRPEPGSCEQWPPLHPVFDWSSVTLPRPAGAESCLAEVDWNGPAAEERIDACLEHDSVKWLVPSFNMLWKIVAGWFGSEANVKPHASLRKWSNYYGGSQTACSNTIYKAHWSSEIRGTIWYLYGFNQFHDITVTMSGKQDYLYPHGLAYPAWNWFYLTLVFQNQFHW